MTTLKFNPKVFTVSFEGSHGLESWDLLTVDGETPANSVYFMLENDMPSIWSQDKISEAIENEDYVIYNLENTDYKLTDFEFDASIFDTTGEGYTEIKQIIKLYDIAKKHDVILSFDEEQGQIYFISEERLCDELGHDLIEYAKKIESEVMDLLDCEGALLQSRSSEIDFYTLAFNHTI